MNYALLISYPCDFSQYPCNTTLNAFLGFSFFFLVPQIANNAQTAYKCKTNTKHVCFSCIFVCFNHCVWISFECALQSFRTQCDLNSPFEYVWVRKWLISAARGNVGWHNLCIYAFVVVFSYCFVGFVILILTFFLSFVCVCVCVLIKCMIYVCTVHVGNANCW